MEGCLDASYGMMVTLYSNKLELFKTDTETLIKYYENTLADIKRKLPIAQERLEYYKGQCELEDKQEKEL